jgi:hypothetical protein
VSLPDLLVIGVPKAGTGSLFAYLAQHPDVCASSEKETGYFTAASPNGRSRPVADYERFFAHRRQERYAMEATPAYCYGGPRVRAAIRETLGAPRLLLILREPAERLWSAYTFQRSLGHLPPEVRSFAAYVAACERERVVHADIHDQGFLKGLSIGMYGAFVPPWVAEFPDLLRVLFFDDLRADPHAVVSGVCRWLGIDREIADTFSYDARNPTVHPRSLAAARGAAMARSIGHRLLGRAPGIRRGLRDAYMRLNRGSIGERPSTETLAHLAELHAPSNLATAEALRALGVGRLPGWLDGAEVASGG